MPRLHIVFATLIVLIAATASANEASPAGRVYAVGLAATTVAYRPPGGSFGGPAQDVSPVVGLGYYLSDAWMLELDVGATFVEGRYASWGISPAVMWAFHPNFYGAGRFMIPLDPELNFALLPALGATYVFDNGLAPFLEVEALSTVGRGELDVGIALALGLAYLL